jgi:magnesium-transporting ATPase (P-type)
VLCCAVLCCAWLHQVGGGQPAAPCLAPPTPSLQAASPDEEALVQGGAYLGVKLLSRSADTVELARRLTDADKAAQAGGKSSSGAAGRWGALACMRRAWPLPAAPAGQACLCAESCVAASSPTHSHTPRTNTRTCTRRRKAATASALYGAIDAVERWSVLAVVEFSSDRKRMSTVCRAPDGGWRGASPPRPCWPPAALARLPPASPLRRVAPRAQHCAGR